MTHVRGFPIVGVIGPGTADVQTATDAFSVGQHLASSRCHLVTGGLGGVMLEASRGFVEARRNLPSEKQGLVLGVLPASAAADANPFVDLAIPTGIGEARNFVLVNTATVLIAIGQGDGTLVEIGYALRAGKRVISLSSWEIDGRLIRVSTPFDAVSEALLT